VNAVFPRNLAKLGEAKNIPVIHLTTDCVYTGSRGSYSERDYFDATDFYGTSKNSGDITSCMTLRTSIVGEERGQARSLLEWARSQAGKTVNGFTNHFWNGVTTLQFAKIVDRIFSNGLYKKGIFHLHSPDTVTKAQLLKIFSDAYALNLSVQQVEAAEFCDRSLSSQESLSRDLCTLTIAEQVREMREFGLKHP
jgi:dTDP-4-dehydrorhamnose reductase